MKNIYNNDKNLIIGEDVYIGKNVVFLTKLPDLKQDDFGPISKLPQKTSSIKIERGAYIGDNSLIMPGIVIGEGAFVLPGSIVRENISRYSIVTGNPAQKIGIRESGDKRTKRTRLTLIQWLRLIVGHTIRYFFDSIFFILFSVAIFYSWIRFGFKKAFHLKPSVIVSPLGEPLPFNNVKALRKTGYKADNIAYNCPSYFRKIGFGLILEDYFYLRILNYLSDYTFLFLWAIFKYDIFEFSFSGGLLRPSHLRKIEYILLKLCAKKIAVYGHGADCKILSDIRKQGFKYNTAMDRNEETESQTEEVIRGNVGRAQKYAGVLIVGGDLIHLGEKGIFLPIPADLTPWKYSPQPKSKIVKIIHSTNHRSHKGSRFIIDIVSKLEGKLPIKLVLLEKKTIAECQKLYPLGDIVITDVITGWHGYTAIEAMAIGRPVITYLRPDIMKFHSYYAKGRIPVISATPDNLAREIEHLVKNSKLRKELGQRGREYVLKYHSLEFIGALRSILYEYIWAGKKINQRIFEKEVRKRKLIG